MRRGGARSIAWRYGWDYQSWHANRIPALYAFIRDRNFWQKAPASDPFVGSNNKPARKPQANLRQRQ